MNCIVCMKQVPDTEAKIRISGDGKTIEESDVNFIVNPFDEFAVEEALKIKESKGGEVVLITAGKERATAALRTCLAMGADRAVLIKDDALERSDSLTIARALASVIETMQYDIILFGKMGVGTDNGQIGPMVAELLSLPHIGVVVKLEVMDGKVKAHREIEGASEVVEAALPVIITAQKGLNEPRYASLKGIMMAKKKEIAIKSLSDVGLKAEEVGESGTKIRCVEMTLPPARVGGKLIDGEPHDAAKELARLLREEAKII